jgi:uncharacterized protein YfiM (DUF2279 family)
VKKLFLSVLIICGCKVNAQIATEALAKNYLQDCSFRSARIFMPTLTAKQKQNRSYLIGGVHAAVYGGMFVGLSAAWYKNYAKSSFHTYNDAAEWLQMDKVGHAWTVYTASRWSYGMFSWAGQNNTKATLLSSGSALAYMLSIEYLDGRSAEWGWSWPDVGADIFGAALFTAQQLKWKQQKVYLKFSSHRIQYGAELETRANALFGKSLPERLLKDYNAQSYWLSFKFPGNKIPAWLGWSIGYGAKGMLGGYSNIAYDKNGNIVFDRSDIKRQRQWYLAPDVDLTKIKTKSRLLRSVFYTVNSLKFPAPALEFSGGKLHGKWLMF